MSKIKICGLSRSEDIDAVNRALPDYIGFVFADSSRRVDEDTAGALKARLDPQILSVGVFVNCEIEAIADLYDRGVIDLVQLHGDEDAAYIADLKACCGCPIIKAIGIADATPSTQYPSPQGSAVPSVPPSSPAQPEALTSLQSPPPLSPDIDYYLFDALSAKRGGTGQTFDWHLLEHYSGPPYFLAGGISTDNIAQAIRRLAPYCIDVSSGAETDGRKDPDKIEQLVRLARSS